MLDFKKMKNMAIKNEQDPLKEELDDLIEDVVEEKPQEQIENFLYKEYEIIVNKIIYMDEYSGFCIFSALPKNLRKRIYSNVNGKERLEHNFVVKIQDKESCDLVNENANLLVTGEWIEDEHYGVQFFAKDISQVLIEEEKDIKKFLQSKGLESVDKKIANSIISECTQKELLIKSVLEDPILLNKIEVIKEHENKFLARNIAFEWFHYIQGHKFSEKLSKYGLKRGKAIKIYNFIIKPQSKNPFEELNGMFKKENFRESFIELKNLKNIKNKDFKLTIDHLFYEKIYDYFLINPYDYLQVSGIGFKTIDEVSLNLGIDQLDRRRIQAIITNSIEEECLKTGNTLALRDEIFGKITAIKGITRENAIDIFKDYAAKKKIIYRKMDLGNGEKVYISTDSMFIAEFVTAKKIELINNYKLDIKEEAIKEIESEAFNNDKSQSLAVKNAYLNPVSIITGGPGSGKTTTLKKLIYIYRKYESDKQIILLAPTGMASKRIANSINSEENLKNILSVNVSPPSTIHRFIFYDDLNPKSKENPYQFHKNSIFIIDESSMLDSLLMYTLIKKINEGCRIVFVGDIDQIPPVGIGQIMRDLINSNKISISRLTNIHRVDKNSKIPENAQLINQGIMPKDFGNYMLDDYSFIPCDNDLEIVMKIEEVIKNLLSKNEFKQEDIQIISPQWSGVVGVNELNGHFKWLLNENLNYEDFEHNLMYKPNIKSHLHLMDGDRVINNKNNYELDIFNGEMGIVKNYNESIKSFEFYKKDENKNAFIDKKTFGYFGLSYAITVHKAQGSEAPVIILPLSKAHSYTLNKFLLYTGITRAKNKIIIIGGLNTMYATLNKKDQGKRLTGLIYEMEHWKEHEEAYNNIITNDNYIDMSIDDDL